MFRLVLLLCLVFAGGVGAQSNYTLPFRPLDAEYSIPLNRIVMISSSPHRLQIYDPATQGNVAVNLPAAPLDLSLSPNGLFAAVGHDGSVSYVNLASGTLERSYPVVGRVVGLVAGARFVYLENAVSSWGSQLFTLDLLSGTVFGSVSGSYRLAGARLHPRGDAIYLSVDFRPAIDKITLRDSLPIPRPNTLGPQPQVCGGNWISADGESLYNGCSAVFGLSPVAALDLQYRGALPDQARAQGVWEFSGRDEVAVITEAGTEVRLYKKGTLRPAGRWTLDPVLVNGTNQPVRGRWVFANGGTELYVIAQADATAGLAQEFSLRVFDVAATAPCAPQVSATTVTAPGEGGIVTVNVTGGAGCLYRAEAAAEWLRTASEALRYGTGEAQFLVRPNGGTARTGTVSLGGTVVTVNQAAKTAPQPNPLPLGYPLQAAAYSRSQERLLLLSAEPPELHVLNPLTNEERVVALRQRGLTVEVDPTGNTAAVGQDGWVTLVDLGSGTVTREYPVATDAQSMAWGGNGYLYLIGNFSRQPVLNLRLADGIWTTAPDGTANCPLGRRQPGSTVLLLCGRRWSMAGGELADAGFASPTYASLYWLFEQGDRLVTNSGEVRRVTTTAADDWSLVSQLAPSGALSSAEHSLTRRTLAVTGVVPSATSKDEVRLYGDEQLGLAGRQEFASGVRGRGVFWNQSGTTLFALGTATTGGAAQVMSISTAANAAGCTATFASGTAAVGTNESINPAAVTAGGGCAWTATSSASWLRILSGSFGIGAASLSYAVEANRLAVGRTATITLSGGATLTVTQSAMPVAVEPVSVTIGAAGGARSFAVTTAAPGTAGTATATVPWVTFAGSAAGAGNGTVNYVVAPNPGAARSGLIRVNAANFSILQEAGSSTVIPNSPPSFVSAETYSNGQSTFVFRDPNGANDLGVVNVLINRALDARNACYIAYNAATEQLYLVADSGAGLLELAASPPSAVVENSQCRIRRASVTANKMADRLTLNLTAELKGSFGFNTAVYAAARDRAEANSGWQAASVFRSSSIQGSIGSLGSYSWTQSSTGDIYELRVGYSTTDMSSAGAITSMQVLINSALDANGACYIGVDRAAMRAYLVTDDGQGLLPGGVALGTQTGPRGTTENSRCVLLGEGSSLTSTSWNADVLLTLRLQLKGGFTGNRFIYTGAQAAGAGRNSGWELLRAVQLN
ncbi:MAG: BACON domain-containing protein [Acidobacteriota bacterium]